MDPAAVQNVADPRKLAGIARGLASGKNSRISNGIALILIIFAAFADLLSLVPFAGDIVGPVFWIGISIYLYAKGCGFVRAGRLVTEGISFLAEMVPVIQELPTIIVGMIIVIALIRLEDRTGVLLIKPGSQGKLPLNSGGVRQPQASLEEPEDSINSSRNPNTRPLNIDGVRQPRP